MSDFLLINLNSNPTPCGNCGKLGEYNQGIPVCASTGIIVANDYIGEWCGITTCKECHSNHENGQFVGDWPKG